ncbi:hypothetical protein RCO27_16870 [Sphingosinicella sp. LHD-64]|uniref:hypothetical protein n=1 Tax=Sphingosinicella sp. LHD-64 TaxID=3072139 RepID=UPI00280D5C30|nr:hypothetical protein [Sphingosinicella sp. LHD-64]MDQ8757901.1 hypothetical protein [Sphingosinicella sp. LHD-64]
MPATAQNSVVAQPAPTQNTPSPVIGPPQLRDFSLQPQERIVTQPQPAPQAPPVRVAPPSPVATRPAQSQPRSSAPSATTRPAPQASAPQQQAPAPSAGAPLPTIVPPTNEPAPPPAEAPAPIPSLPAPARPAEESGAPWWLYALPVALLALIGAAVTFRRRRRAGEEGWAEEAAPVAAAAPPPPRLEPGERPWIELDLKTDRASFTATEASIQFQLEIRNAGKTTARNVRIDVKMFNAGAEQDKEIGAFFRTAGRQSTKLSLPGIATGASGTIRGEVAMTLEEMRAVRLNDRMLFIPVVAVNALYDCGDGRTGQSSKSYVVGRELQQQTDKMGAFRVDQGPRIWRTVGQRPHKLTRRV